MDKRQDNSNIIKNDFGINFFKKEGAEFFALQLFRDLKIKRYILKNDIIYFSNHIFNNFKYYSKTYAFIFFVFICLFFYIFIFNIHQQFISIF